MNSEEELFEKYMYMVDRVYNSRFNYNTDYMHKEDMKQEGYIGLWKALKKNRIYNVDRTIDEARLFMDIYSYMGAYVRNKNGLGVDKRIKSREKNSNVLYYDKTIEGTEGIKYIQTFKGHSDICECEEYISEENFETKFFTFFDNVDKYCNLKYKFSDILNMKYNGLDGRQCSKKLNMNYQTFCRKLWAARDIYRDTFA